MENKNNALFIGRWADCLLFFGSGIRKRFGGLFRG